MCEYSIKLNAYLQAAAIRSSTIVCTSLLRLLQHILLRFLHPRGGKHVFRSSNGAPWLVRALALAELRRLSRMISPMSQVIGLTNLGALSFGKFWKIYAVRAVNERQTSLRM